MTEHRSQPALAARGMRKTFGDNVAVDDVDLTVEQGAFFGLVGPNGAGKTTLLSMMVGLLQPDRGRSSVLGHPVWLSAAADDAKRLLGVMPDGLALPARLTGRELLTYLGRLRRMDRDVLTQRVEELLRVLDLETADATLVGDYSTGMRKKLALAAAVLHAPRVLVLDEPFEAVDPLSARVVRSILDGFIDSGGTVLMSSHVMTLVEQLCDHVAVLHAGRILCSGTLDAVRAGRSLEEAFAALVGATAPTKGLSWFGS